MTMSLRQIVVDTLMLQGAFGIPNQHLHFIFSIFGNYKQKYLIVPPTPQSPKFLENIDAEIRQLFRFSKQINTRVAAYIDKLFE